MPQLSAIGALNVFDLRRAQAIQPQAIQPIQGEAPKLLAFTSSNYNLGHPRANDSEGIIAGTSHLANKLDLLG